ncbi:MAG: bifunctional phosphoribosylaminoimidazolecarboxamide formyltransferase/IMP cyclohydrolase, partial [Acidobacteriota bacterium]|nr:bifunctional phosphoribosylaminoimidazolecarboxamide formyltransferase/IMP cyclohydrolase [Acidobacteriota bacterium]
MDAPPQVEGSPPAVAGAETEAGAELVESGGVRIRRAILSVHDKSGIVDLARGLRDLGVEILSTGGTAREIEQAGIELRTVSDFTGFPEIMDGRVKTLHPHLYGGILARRDDPAHLQEAAAQGIEEIDLVCVNLYPFERTVARPGVGAEEAIENIDIGGPTMIRAAAKNHRFVVVLVDPADYQDVLEELRFCEGRLPLGTRERLAARAFAYTARYDASIYRWFAPRAYEGFPPRWASAYEKVMDLRYGENPHQRAAFFAEVGAPAHLLSDVTQLHGKELSFNNLLDLAAARDLVDELAAPDPAAPDAPPPAAVAILKHNNPCGCAVADRALDAYQHAFACDPQSAFGGIIALNRPVDGQLARAISNQRVEVLLAPGYDEDALAVLRERKNTSVLDLDSWPERQLGPDGRPVGVAERPVLGGMLVQTRDSVFERREDMRVVTKA